MRTLHNIVYVVIMVRAAKCVQETNTRCQNNHLENPEDEDERESSQTLCKDADSVCCILLLEAWALLIYKIIKAA